MVLDGRLRESREGSASAARSIKRNRMKTRVTPLFVGDFLGQPGMPLVDGQRIVVIAYLVEHAGTTVLFDTGIAPHLPRDDELAYRFERRPVTAALDAAGVPLDRVDVVVNSHLHADHAGANDAFRGRPIFVQRAELEAAVEPGFTEPSAADVSDGNLNVIDGVAELGPGLRILPTPGHTPGHQSLVVTADEGSIVLLGQAFRTASEYSLALRARERRLAGNDAPAYPEWVDEVAALDPWRVLLAHDYASWRRGETASFGQERGSRLTAGGRPEPATRPRARSGQCG
jgi:N-acyl homoserine lactone hydrolase